jgi:hypothetical protein
MITLKIAMMFLKPKMQKVAKMTPKMAFFSQIRFFNSNDSDNVKFYQTLSIPLKLASRAC